ncbi:MAG: AI-2E family transporter [Candidatus Peregrinibacteria bacterium]|nr:AI-2E family transporter [Candidatus Peregrinibacteria bacterium]
MAKKNTRPSKGILSRSSKRIRALRDKVNKLKERQIKNQEKAAEEMNKIEMPHQPKTEKVLVEFSVISVAKATLVVLGLFVLAQFLFEIGDILVLIFISLFLASALDSIVDRLEGKGVPRTISILGIYFSFFIVLALFISTLIPLVATQTLELARTASDLIANVTQSQELWSLPYTENLQQLIKDFLESADQETIIANLQTGLEQLSNQLQNIAGNTWGAIKVIFDGIFNAILVLVLTFFMVVNEKGIERFLVSLFPSKHAKYIIAKSDAVKEKIGFWLRGQLKLMVAMTVITFIGLTLLGVDYALTLALLAGITELLPVVGPIIAMIPALLIGLNDSLSLTFWIFMMYIIIQQVEGNILVPLIMNKAVGLSPIIIVIAMLIGFQFLGIMGIIISVPVATAISIFIKDYAAKTK